MNPMPDRIARLPKDRRGYPIPWNVLRGADETPFFTVNDSRRQWKAFLEALCPICGEKLGTFRWWVGGPLSAFDEHGWYLDLPGHQACMRFALETCPYLAMPKYLGRVDVVHPEKLPPEARVFLDETMIPDRPEIFVAVSSGRVELQPKTDGENVQPLLPYTRPKRPYADVEYWRHGQQLSFAEAEPFLYRSLIQGWKEQQRHESARAHAIRALGTAGRAAP